jgi:hypothetical protein
MHGQVMPGLLGNQIQSWHSIEERLRLFSTKRPESRFRYASFIANRTIKQEIADLSGGGLIRSYGGWGARSRMRVEHQARIGDARILSGADFVDKALMENTLSLEWHTAVGQLGWDLPTLCAAIIIN